MFILNCLAVLIFFYQNINSYQEFFYTENGGNATLKCPYEDDSVVWRGVGGHQYSKGGEILTSLPTELQQRCSIEKNNGYNLLIVKTTFADEGNYTCSSQNQSDRTTTIYIKVPPEKVSITNGENGIIKTDENQNLLLECTVDGGQPTPMLTLMLDDRVLVSLQNRAITSSIILNRTDDLTNVTCYAEHSLLTTPITDTSIVVLYLGPTAFGMKALPVLYEGSNINVSCESSGSRPPAQVECFIEEEFINATEEKQILQPDRTYRVESVMLLEPKRDYNKEFIYCFASNKINSLETTQEIEVYFPPSITVELEEDANMVQLKCKMDGNPKMYNPHKWKHSSQFDEPIRNLNQKSDSVIKFPFLNETVSFEESGKYSCLGDNGIADSDGEVVQSGSIVVKYNGPPHLTATNNLNQYGDVGSDVTIPVAFVSLLPLLSYDWYFKIDVEKSNLTSIQTGMKYNIFKNTAIVQDIVYNTTVHANGHICTLLIRNAISDDFGVYQFVAENSKGKLSVVINLEEKATDKAYTPTLTESEHQVKMTGIILTVVGSIMILASIAFFIWTRRETSTCYPLEYNDLGDEIIMDQEEKYSEIPDIDHHEQTLVKIDINHPEQTQVYNGEEIHNDEEETTFVVEHINHPEQTQVYNDDDAEFETNDTVAGNQESLPRQRAKCPSPQNTPRDDTVTGNQESLPRQRAKYPSPQNTPRDARKNSPTCSKIGQSPIYRNDDLNELGSISVRSDKSSSYYDVSVRNSEPRENSPTCSTIGPSPIYRNEIAGSISVRSDKSSSYYDVSVRNSEPRENSPTCSTIGPPPIYRNEIAGLISVRSDKSSSYFDISTRNSEPRENSATCSRVGRSPIYRNEDLNELHEERLESTNYTDSDQEETKPKEPSNEPQRRDPYPAVMLLKTVAENEKQNGLVNYTPVCDDT